MKGLKIDKLPSSRMLVFTLSRSVPSASVGLKLYLACDKEELSYEHTDGLGGYILDKATGDVYTSKNHPGGNLVEVLDVDGVLVCEADNKLKVKIEQLAKLKK